MHDFNGEKSMDAMKRIGILKLERDAVLQKLDVAMKYAHRKPIPLVEYRILMRGAHSYMKQLILIDDEIEVLNESLGVKLE